MKTLTLILRKKLVLAALAAVVVGSGAYAFAATLGVGSSTLQAGNANVTGCETSTLTPSYTTRFVSGAYEVDTVTIKDIDAACAGKTLKIAFTDGSNVLLGSELTTAAIVAPDNVGASPTTPLTVTAGGGVHISAQSTAKINIAVA
jgi:hypothetical protein